MLFVVFPVFGYKLDHVCFLVTGKRLIDLDLELLYTPTGMGPWAYMPPAALFFAPFSAVGMETGSTLSVLFNFLCLSLLIILMANHFCRPGARDLKTFGLIAAATCAYHFIVWESLNLGQVDIFLTLLASLFLFYNPPAPTSGALFAVMVNFKPQFAIFTLLQFYRRGLLLILWIAFAFAALAAAYIALTLVIGKPNLYFDQMLQYKVVAGAITQSKDVTNQSLDGALRRLFSAGDYLGRYSPAWYAPGPMSMHVAVLPNAVVNGLSVFLRAAFMALAALSLRAARREGRIDPEYFFIVLAMAIPIVSPLFWQAHMIQLLPVSTWLLVRGAESGRWPVVVPLVCALLAIAVGNPGVLGQAGADTAQAYSLYTLAILMHAVLCLTYPRWRGRKADCA